MSLSKVDNIYSTLKKELEQGNYSKMMLLPTETELSTRFDASRNTIRQAIKMLNSEGLTYSIKGRGVVVLEPVQSNETFFKLNNYEGLEGFKTEHPVKMKNIVLHFEEKIIDDDLAQRISFQKNEPVFFVERIRLINGKKMMRDTSFFKKKMMGDLSRSIAEESIYKYINYALNWKIIASKTKLQVVSATKRDYETLDLAFNNCVGKLENFVYCDTGELFEYNESRFIPNKYALINFNGT